MGAGIFFTRMISGRFEIPALEPGLIQTGRRTVSSGRRVLWYRIYKYDQPALTSMDLEGDAFASFGRWTRSTPSLKSAVTLSPETPAGRVKLRMKLPYSHSMR